MGGLLEALGLGRLCLPGSKEGGHGSQPPFPISYVIRVPAGNRDPLGWATGKDCLQGNGLGGSPWSEQGECGCSHRAGTGRSRPLSSHVDTSD